MNKNDKENLKERFRRLELLISEFIRKSPEFKGDLEIAKSIGSELGDIKWKIENS